MTNSVLDREEKAYFHLIFNGKDPVNRIMMAQIQVGQYFDMVFSFKKYVMRKLQYFGSK